MPKSTEAGLHLFSSQRDNRVMAVGPLRGGGAPLVPPSSERPQTEPKQPQKLLEKAVDGVLKPGQHMVLPARTGLAHLADHFDARLQPDYDKLLKGEAAPKEAKDAKAEPVREHASAPPESHASQDAATSFAAQSAMQMMDLLPPIAVPPPIPMARASELADVEDAKERERQRREPQQQEQGEQRESGDGGTDEDFAGAAPTVEKRSFELQAGVFTLDEGSVDIHARRLCTLEAFLDGDVPFVSCAVDLDAIPDGANLRIPALDAAVGRPVQLRARHQNERTEGVGSAYLEVCVSERERWQAVLEKIVAVEVG